MKKQKPKNRKPVTKPKLITNINSNSAVVIKPILEAMPEVASQETVFAEAIGDNMAAKTCPHNATEKQKLIAYTLGFAPSQSRPGPAQREFMDSTSNRFAYRCLPLNIANQYGWELLSPCTFDAVWNGETGPDAIDITVHDSGWPAPVSHFGNGVLTFHINQIFRTPPGMQLMVTGPINSPKDGIYAMTGIIETDWSHYSFTMNWVMTRPYFPIRFEKGEPFAHIMPVNLAAIEQIEPVYMPIDSNPELKSAYEHFQNSRNAFNDALNDPESEATKEKWQKGYFRGNGPNGCPVGGFSHWTKLDVAPFPGSKLKKK
ncbi:MAG: hypothetical protein J0L55_13170 [Caulobacterales bacterium]|nr:hypothetical protein [Caulobacterales bacterium]